MMCRGEVDNSTCSDSTSTIVASPEHTSIDTYRDIHTDSVKSAGLGEETSDTSSLSWFFPEVVSSSAQSLIASLLHPDPVLRPNAAVAIQHPWCRPYIDNNRMERDPNDSAQISGYESKDDYWSSPEEQKDFILCRPTSSIAGKTNNSGSAEGENELLDRLRGMEFSEDFSLDELYIQESATCTEEAMRNSTFTGKDNFTV